jgi:outer membrane immunogenic protein
MMAGLWDAEDTMRASPAIAALALLLSPLAAQAADLYGRPAYPPQPPYYAPAPRPIWTGFYVGGFLGGSIGDQKLAEHGANQFFATTGTGGATLLSPTNDPETPFGFDDHKTGFTGGGFAGYNYQFGRVVIGAEGDFAIKRLESSASETVVTNAVYTNTGTTGQTDTASRSEFFSGLVRQNWDASARLRVGGLVTPSILLYGTGGLALGSVDSAFSYSATTVYNEVGGGSITHTTFGTGSWNDLRLGWTAGAGVEAALAPNWKVRAEYRFTDFGSSTKTVPLTRTSSSGALPNSGSAAAAADVSASFHTLRLGVAYSF